MLANDFDVAVGADEAVEAFGGEAEEVGAVGGVGEVGVPEVAFLADVAYMVDEGAPAVVYPEFVHGVLPDFEEVEHAPGVVGAVAVGGDEVGELEPCGDDFDLVGDGVEAGMGDEGVLEGEGGVVVGEERDVEGALWQVAGPAVVGLEDGEGVDAVHVLDFPAEVAAVGYAEVDEARLGGDVDGHLGSPGEVGGGCGEDVDGPVEGVAAVAAGGDFEGEELAAQGGVEEEGGFAVLGLEGEERPVPCGGAVGAVEQVERLSGAEDDGDAVVPDLVVVTVESEGTERGVAWEEAEVDEGVAALLRGERHVDDGGSTIVDAVVDEGVAGADGEGVVDLVDGCLEGHEGDGAVGAVGVGEGEGDAVG